MFLKNALSSKLRLQKCSPKTIKNIPGNYQYINEIIKHKANLFSIWLIAFQIGKFVDVTSSIDPANRKHTVSKTFSVSAYTTLCLTFSKTYCAMKF